MITKLSGSVSCACVLCFLTVVSFGCSSDPDANTKSQLVKPATVDRVEIKTMNELTASVERLKTYGEMVSLLGLPKRVSGSGISICEYDVVVQDSAVRRVVIRSTGESAESKILSVKWLSDLDANN